MFTAALCHINFKLGTVQMPNTSRRIHKLWYSDRMEYCTTMGVNLYK